MFLTLGLAGAAGEGFQTRVAVVGYRPDNQDLQRASWALLGSTERLPPPVGDPRDDRRQYADPGSTRFLVLGNSLGKDLYNALAHHPGLAGRVEVARYGAQVRDLSDPGHAAWRAPSYAGAHVVFFATHYAEADMRVLATAVARVRAEGKRAVIVAQSPVFPGDIARTRADEIVLAEYRFGPGPPTAEAGAVFLDRLDYLCDADRRLCHVMAGDLTKHFYDQHHTTMAGAKFFGRRMEATGWLDPVLGGG